MTEVRHADLLEKISGYVKHLLNGKFRSAEKFERWVFDEGFHLGMNKEPCFFGYGLVPVLHHHKMIRKNKGLAMYKILSLAKPQKKSFPQYWGKLNQALNHTKLLPRLWV